jgi:hypothetical protein
MDMKKILQAMDGIATKPVEGSNDMKKFVSIIQEGTNPHKVALPVQMAMNHYQTAVKPVIRKDRLIDKYFTEAEAAITQRKEQKRAKINQYASVIAEQVLMKGSKKKILNEGTLEVLKPDGKSDDYNSVQFRIDGKTVERGSEDFDYYYKLVFKKNPPGGKDDFIDTLKGMMDKDYGSMGADPMKDSENDVQNGDVIIPSHPKPKGKWVKISDIVEAGSNAIDTVAKRLTDPKDGMTAKLRAAGDARREDKLKGRNISRRDTTSKDEWGDLKELSTDLLRDYKTAAGADAKKADAAGDFERGNKRFKGINKATTKQFDNDAKKHKELSESRTDYTAEEMADMLTGKRTQKQVDADAEKTRGPDKGKPKKESLDQLLALRNKIDEAIKQRLDPKCWKGKHKEGTKVKGGVRVNNCVPNKR